jgi:hypothetical protein
MTTMAKLATWLATSGVVLYVAFSSDGGLLFRGPWAAIGIVLMAAGVWKQTRAEQRQAVLIEA